MANLQERMKERLHANPNIVVVSEADHGNNQNLSRVYIPSLHLAIAPKQGLYGIDDLQEFYDGVAEGFPLAQGSFLSKPFRAYQGVLHMANITLQEPVIRRENISYQREVLLDAPSGRRNVIETQPYSQHAGDLTRDTRIQLFPDEAIARAAQEYRLRSCTGSTGDGYALSDMAKISPGFQAQPAQGQGIVAKVRAMMHR